MNRTIIPLAATLGALTPFLFDSALKGAVLLAVAALGALVLWRASAAARHLVWLVAVVAVLLVPVLSVALPQWRILPGWVAGPKAEERTQGTQRTEGTPLPTALPEASAMPQTSPPPWAAAGATAPAIASVASVPSVPLVPSVPGVSAAPHWLAPAWAAGFMLLALRLFAAHFLLSRSARRSAGLGVPPPSGAAGRAGGPEAVESALAAACAQLDVRQRVTLIFDDKRTIPVVWGVFRPHLMLPVEAREWGDDQLRSVILHELGHVRRRDTLVQWLAQVACALHWWNPLVWLAAWRLHVERERACDDLVLASGVRPSAYAEHLLHVATRLSPVRWTAACGLAMARRSSLEGRLLAVLSENLNRRGVTSALAAMALVLGACVAVPIAMLRAAEPDPPKTDAPVVNAGPKDARSGPLFENWKSSARSDGKIPGGRIGEMAASLRTFIDLNPGHEQSVKLEPVLKKCDPSRDWAPSEAAALLDEIAAITPRAEWTMRANVEREIHPGQPLPDELATAPWGQPAANGLRIAWLLEPRAETQALDSVMKSRVLFHNTGKAPVYFATGNWIQSGGHKAKDANGKAIGIWAAARMGIRTRMVFRLAPGEYAEVEGHGLGVGSHETASEKSIYKVGCWIEAQAGDEVTFTPGSVPVSFQTWQNNEGLKDSATVWRELIAARVLQESPMPPSTADRERLLRRVMQDFPGTAPTPEELAAFTADNAPDALEKLTASLQARAAAMHFAGELSGGETKFRVTAAEPKEPGKRGAAVAVQPKHEAAQALFRKWQASARTDGKIPGALVGHVAREVDGFLKRFPADEKTPKLAALRPRLDASRDWDQSEVVALLDDITAISTAPVSWADIPMEFSSMRSIQGGQPLPIELTSAAWGEPMANGLRAAWLLDPRAEQYPLGSVLKARVLFHNTGKAPVVFKTETWHQSDPHRARDAMGAEIKVGSTWYSGITPMATFRLAPDEYCEVKGHGIAIGAGEYTEEHSTGTVGAIIEAKEGDEVSLSHSVDTTYGGWSRPDDPKDPIELWRATIAERVANEAPIPRSPADREQLIRRVTRDIFGEPPTAEEITAFSSDDAPDALARFTARLQARQRIEPFAGKLPTGQTKFRVIAADPDAAKAPRTANAPGRYVLGDNAHLLVSQLTEGDKRTNRATIAFLSPDPKVASPHKPHEIALPDGIGTYGIVWDRGSGALWVMQKGLVRKYEFTNPAQVREMRIEPGSIINIPAHMQEALKKTLDLPGAPRQGATLERAMLEGFWEGERDGVKVEVRFLWLNEHQQVQWDVTTGPGASKIGAQMSVVIDPDGRAARLVFRKGLEFEATQGRLTPGEGGTLRLEIIPNPRVIDPGYPVVNELVLTRQPDPVGPSSKPGAQLQPSTEQKLKWGGPANGLRMALAWPPTLDEPGMGDAPEFLLVVQNVSEGAVRLTASDAAPNPRRLMMRDKGRPLQALRDTTPMPGDWLLQPREVAFVRLFQQGEKEKDGRITSAAIEESIRSFPQYSMTAEMSIEKAPAGAWTGKLGTGETRGSVDVIPPRDKDATALLSSWTTAARRDGKIPGALIGLLAESVETFIKNNPTWETTTQLEKMLPRFDATHDWSGADAVALLDELAALQSTPIAMALDREDERIMRTGAPLPPQLADAPWGEALTNGLRVAYVLEPSSAEHRLNSPLKARILIHNAGNEHVVFRTRGWHQLAHTARDATGAELKVEAVSWTTRGQLAPYRLAAGEFVELHTTGIGVGANKDPDDWQNTRVGSWLDVKPGDKVTVTTGEVPLSDWNEEGNGPNWWLDHITARLSRHLPFPADKAGRELLLYRVAMELFGNPVNESVNAAFVADSTPGSLDSLAERLARREGVVPFTITPFVGTLKPAPTRFRVLPADPDAAKRPRTASNPGRYTLGENVRFVVTRRPEGERIVNEADITFYPPGKDHISNRVTLPDGYDTWAAAWEPGTTVMWVSQKGPVRRIDFTNPANLEETRYEAERVADAPVPQEIREALRAALAVPDPPRQAQDPLTPAAPAAPAPPARSEGALNEPQPTTGVSARRGYVPGIGESREFIEHCHAVAAAHGRPQATGAELIKWGEPVRGLRAGLLMTPRAELGVPVQPWFVVRNVSPETMTAPLVLSWNTTPVLARGPDGKTLEVSNLHLRGADAIIQCVLKPGEQIEMKTQPIQFGGDQGDGLVSRVETAGGKCDVHFDLRHCDLRPAPEASPPGRVITLATGNQTVEVKPTSARPRPAGFSDRQ